MIRHADRLASFTVLSLTVAMVESSFRALLVPAIGAAPLFAPGNFPAGGAAIAMAPVTMGADEEHGVAAGAHTHALPQNRLAMRRHVPSQTGAGQCDPLRGTFEPAWCATSCGLPIQEPRRLQRRGSSLASAFFDDTLYPKNVPAMMGQMTRAFGADDVDRSGWRSENYVFR